MSSGITAGAERGPYKMRTIARLTEFSPALLRAWERRHGLLKPLRGPGGHRMYTDEDLQVLLRVRALIKQGRSIGEIASAGREPLLREGAAMANAARDQELRPIEPAGQEMIRELERWRTMIVQAALEMDPGEVSRALDETFARVSAETAIFEVIKPTAEEIGDLWAQGRCTVASEHLASGVFVHRLRKLVESAEPSRSPLPPVIVACFPDEYHQLGALMIAYLLVRNGLRVRFLGAALPFEDLESGCEVIQPCAVLLSVTRIVVFSIHRQRLIEAIRRRSRASHFYVGGQGAPERDPLIEKAGGRVVPASRNPEDPIHEIISEIRETVHAARR